MRGGRNRQSQNPLTRIYESNGPDLKIRGTASHVAEKYVQLARDAQASGDPVAAENYYQHAEHYFRLIAAAQEQMRQGQPQFRPDGLESRGDQFADMDDEGGVQPMMGGTEPHQPYQHQAQHREQPYPPREQPYAGGRSHHQQNRHEGRHGGRPDYRQDHRQERSQDNRERSQDNREHSQDNRQETTAGELPAFITGGGSQPQPATHQNQNGFDGGQPDRFPLHRRRRRRHTGPRGEMSGSPQGDGDDSAPASNGGPHE
ncbi:MAG TPA: DUF4167 domain-containing protein [Xanthobacteraceae bacterium]|nr:DUF4167 domain-containing protein [Xanthobacteraceae bacterium]